MRRASFSTALCLLLALSMGGCDSLPSWMGGTEKPPEKLPGTRIAALPNETKLEPDKDLAATPMTVPAAEANDAWPQHGGNAAAQIDNPALPAKLPSQQSAKVGDGNAFDYRMVISPVVDGGMVFAMDADGHISAHDAKHIGNVRWTSKGVSDEDDSVILGGGLAVDKGRLFATSGKGMVAAFDAATGKELWHQALNIPLRSAPRVQDGRLFVVTADGMTYALDVASGNVLWTHRGINEGSGFLIQATPAATMEWVIAPYSSGDVYALRATDGSEGWSDAVMGVERGSALSLFTGIGGDPVIKDGNLYVAGSADQFAAFQLETGQRIWDQPIGSVNTPWVSDDYVFVLSATDAVVAMNRADGRIRWVRQLPQFADAKEKKERYTWTGPVMAGSRLLVVGAHGQMLEIKPEDGTIIATDDIPEGVYAPPVVAGGVLYLVSQEATLYALF